MEVKEKRDHTLAHSLTLTFISGPIAFMLLTGDDKPIYELMYGITGMTLTALKITFSLIAIASATITMLLLKDRIEKRAKDD